VEKKILLFDLSNTCFEGRMQGSSLGKYGRSKEKRSDCKRVVWAAVVNTQGLWVRSRIYEGNTGDSATLGEIIQSIERTGLPASEKKIIVMDAGISTTGNLRFPDGELLSLSALPEAAKALTKHLRVSLRRSGTIKVNRSVSNG
jgi:transposase